MDAIFSESATTSSLLAAVLKKAERRGKMGTPELKEMMKPAMPPLPKRGLSFSLSSGSASSNNLPGDHSPVTPTPASPRGPLPPTPIESEGESDPSAQTEPANTPTAAATGQSPPQTIKVVFRTAFLGVQFKWQEKNSCCVLHKFANVCAVLLYGRSFIYKCGVTY